MDKVTQQQAANAEESASASEELNAQAEQMKSYVEELSAVVGGSNGVAHQTTPRQESSHRGGGFQRPLALPDKSAIKAGKGLTKGKAIRPDQVIPMNEGGFKDF